MATVLVLASEALKHKTLWNPTILGVLVVLSAVGLFCGSVYLLLSTNLGARLGFLIAMAGLSGWMVLLSTLWLTTGGNPPNVPRGRISEWQLKEIVTDVSSSKFSSVREVKSNGTVLATEELANIRPFAEAGLVVPDLEPGEQPEVPEVPPKFAEATEFLTEGEGLTSYVTGGGTKNVLWHNPKFAVVEYCPTKEVEEDLGAAPPLPACDQLRGREYAVLRLDYGSVRLPPVFYLLGSLVIFVLSLLGLHWRELDERARKAASLAPVPAPST